MRRETGLDWLLAGLWLALLSSQLSILGPAVPGALFFGSWVLRGRETLVNFSAVGRRADTNNGMMSYCGACSTGSRWRRRPWRLVLSSVAGSFVRSRSLEEQGWWKVEARRKRKRSGSGRGRSPFLCWGGSGSDATSALRTGVTVWNWMFMAGRCVEGRCAVSACRASRRRPRRRLALRGRCCPMRRAISGGGK